MMVTKTLAEAKTSAVMRGPMPRTTEAIMVREGDEREEVLEEGAVGVAADAAIGGLQKLFELAEEDGDAEIEDDPLGVGFAEWREA